MSQPRAHAMRILPRPLLSLATIWLALPLAAQVPGLPSGTHVMQSARTSAVRIDAARSFPLDPSCELTRVTAVVIQQGGGIVVADGRMPQLCVFDSRGRLVSRPGRVGGGPGEYRDIRSLGLLPGDSLLVFDARLMRLSILSPSGVFIRSMPMGESPGAGSPMPEIVVTMRDGGLLVGYADVRGAPVPKAEPVVITQTLWRTTRDARRVGSIGRFPIGEHFVQEVSPARGGIAFWELPFGRRLSLVPVNGGFLAGDGSSEGIGAYDLGGRRVATLRPVAEGRMITAADKAAYARASLEEVQGADREVEEQRLGATPYPLRLPLFRTFVMDGRGRLWLEPYPVPGTRQVAPWQVWDLKTYTSHEVVMPAGFVLRAAGGDLVCGTVESEDGELSVQCLRVRG